MNNSINIVEVGPRDGFQSVSCAFIPTEAKIEIIEAIFSSGIRHAEFTSFVSPKAIPQLADAAAVTEFMLERHSDADIFALVPNVKGAAKAYELGLRKVCYVVSLSRSHNMANIRRTHEESLNEFREIRRAYPDLKIDLDLATAFGCPFEGKHRNPQLIVDFLKPYYDLGLAGCCLCDTVGLADPRQVTEIITAVRTEYRGLELEVHFHDTRGLGMLNSMAAVEAGVNTIQTALGGLGGCPFAPGASGNLSTEDTVWMLNEAGFQTGIDFDALLAAAKLEKSLISGNYSGHHINIQST